MNEQIETAHDEGLCPDVDVLHEKLADLEVPGYAAAFDPDEAERAGAFIEDALSEQEARESS